MLMRRVIPCLDVNAGRVVKGVRFSGLRDAGDPAELAERYEQQGADEITLLDVSATLEARGTAAATVASVRERLSIPLTVGGGIKSIDDASRLLDAGADKVALNTAAVADPGLISRCADRFGTQCVVVAIDAEREALAAGGDGSNMIPRWTVRVRSGSESGGLDAVDWACQAAERGAGEILLTSFDRDGTRSGYDLRLTSAVAESVRIPVIASGGAAGPEHLLAALQAGADAVLAASIFHDGEFTVADVKRFLIASGVEIRA